MIKVVVFDFDGVLVDSNRLKRDAFFALFSDGDGNARAIAEEVLERRREQSRFEILGEILSRLGYAPQMLERAVHQYADRYNQMVQQRIAERGVLPGVPRLLAVLASAYRLYVSSGTPELTLNETISRLGCARFFRGVYGWPATKEENLEKILAAERISGREAVVVGDGHGDLRAARALNVFFIGLANEYNGWRQGVPFPLAADVGKLAEIITALRPCAEGGEGVGGWERATVADACHGRDCTQ